jgi:toxin-antitoxin system PIN domain toxin
MTTYLADGNVLIALTVVEHVHHETTIGWFKRDEPALATCPITQGTLLRFLIREGQSSTSAAAVLDSIRSRDWHDFWADDLPYDASHLVGVIGHRQVTDAYLVALARHHQAPVVTLDEGLAALHPDAVHLLVPRGDPPG